MSMRWTNAIEDPEDARVSPSVARSKLISSTPAIPWVVHEIHRSSSDGSRRPINGGESSRNGKETRVNHP